MSQRMNYNSAAPAGMKALGAAYGYIRTSELPSRLVDLVYLRVSQINGCAYCIDMHSRDLLNAGMRIEHLVLVPVWSEACGAFTEQEKAGLAWAEAVTRVSEGGVPDVAYQNAAAVIWQQAARRSDDRDRSYERLQPYRDQLSRDACRTRGLILPRPASFCPWSTSLTGIAASAGSNFARGKTEELHGSGVSAMAPRAHLLIGSATAALLAAGALPGPGATAQDAAAKSPPAVTVAKPVMKDVVEHDEYTGRFEAVDSVEIRARVSGYLDRVAFMDGTLVKKGDLLAVIDGRPYQAALDEAEAAVQSAQARVAFTQGDLQRALALSSNGHTSVQVADQRRQAFESARADLLAAQAAARTARLNVGFTEIRAPISGRISRKLVSEGNLVSADTSLLTTIVSIDPIYFYFDVDERSFLAYERNLQIGSAADSKKKQLPVLIKLTDEKEPTRKGVLDFVDNRVDQATGTMRARASVENKDMFLTPGLFGTIRVPGSTPYQGVLIPDEAVGTDQDRRIVWVVAEDGIASARVVRPGPRIDGYRIVRDGLKGDETIVISGLQRVRAGAKVTPHLKGLPQVRSAEATRSAEVQVR